jgi:hypothetical protein
MMSSADVPPTRGYAISAMVAMTAPRFVDSHRWLLLELDLLGYI